jgi:hypothetical protein
MSTTKRSTEVAASAVTLTYVATLYSLMGFAVLNFLLAFIVMAGLGVAHNHWTQVPDLSFMETYAVLFGLWCVTRAIK